MAPPSKKSQSNKQIQSGKSPVSKEQKNQLKKTVPEPRTFIERLDAWTGPKLNLFFYISLILTVFFGALLFDVKISTGGDDSGYIQMANDFIKGRAFPTWHGPLYPIFLSLPMLIFGVKVVLLKLFSFLFIIAHLFLFFITFRRLVSPAMLALIMLVVAVNSTLLYFASQTYSEAMYMFLQSLIIFLFINTYSAVSDSGTFPPKEQAMQWFITGFFVFLASLTRNIGIVALLVMVIFLLFDRKWKSSAMLTLAYLIFFIPFRIYKNVVWDAGKPKGTSQFAEILMKNPYNKAQGSEDFSGMVIRFFENARLYFSKHFMIGIGLHDPSSTDKSWFVTFVIIIIFLTALYFAFRKSRIMLFISLYLLASVSATFIALQQSWDQMRMVVIYIPLLMLVCSWGLLQLSNRRGFGFLNVFVPGLLILIFFKTLGISAHKMEANQKVLSKNLSGNMYYGFTPDWQNFLRMSQWVGKNIPDSVVVASRKPSMSYIYSRGRDFYGIYRFPSESPDKLLGEIRTRTKDLIVVPNKEFDRKLPEAVQITAKADAVAYVAEGNEIYGVYELREPSAEVFRQALDEFKLHAFSTDSLLNRVRLSSQQCFAVSPDTLINNLRKNRVDYVIVASLRANPNMNTGNIINNIQRYLYFIEQKYPGILVLVHQIGTTDMEEPAWLYQMNYRVYGL